MASSFGKICSSYDSDPRFRVIKNSAGTSFLNFTYRVTEAYNTTFRMDEILAALER
jgi:hypothetical protein